jgi:hypothetical protein
MPLQEQFFVLKRVENRLSEPPSSKVSLFELKSCISKCFPAWNWMPRAEYPTNFADIDHSKVTNFYDKIEIVYSSVAAIFLVYEVDQGVTLHPLGEVNTNDFYCPVLYLAKKLNASAFVGDHSSQIKLPV